MTNRTPLSKQIESAISELREAADAIEKSYRKHAEESNADRDALIAEARDAVERARTSGHGWKVWQRILDELEKGSPDERGTENDRIRRFASFMDEIGPLPVEPYLSYGVSYHTDKADDAIAIIAAYPRNFFHRSALNRDTVVYNRQAVTGPDHDYGSITVFVSAQSDTAVQAFLHGRARVEAEVEEIEAAVVPT